METQKLEYGLATESDREELVNVLCYNMLMEEYNSPEMYDKDSLNKLFDLTVAGKTCWVARDNGKAVGLLAATAVPNMLNSNLLTLSELVWYVMPDYRNGRAALRLFNLFEIESKKYHMSTFSLLPSLGDGLNFLDKRGYKMKEYAFVKVNKWQP